MADSAIEQVRRFNRVVAERIGALEDHFLGRSRPLGEARLRDTLDTVALVIVLVPVMGRWPSPVPRMLSGKIWISLAISALLVIFSIAILMTVKLFTAHGARGLGAMFGVRPPDEPSR